MKRREKAKIPKRQRNQAPRLRKNSGLILATVIFGLIIMYIVLSTYESLTRETIQEVDIVMGQVDKPQTMKGIIIRDEEVYQALASGFLSYYLHDLDKVEKNGQIASIENREDMASYESAIHRIDDSIYKEKLSFTEHLFSKDIAKMNKQMQELTQMNAPKLMGEDIQSLYIFKDKISQHLEIRNQTFLSGVTGGEAEISMREREEYLNQMDASRESIVAFNGGIVSYAVDGLEDKLKVNNRLSVSKEFISSFEEAPFQVPKQEVEMGDLICKVVTNFNWYVASYMPNSLITHWEVGRDETVFVQKDDSFEKETFLIDELIPGEDETYVVFKSNKYLHEYIDKRVISIRLSEELVEGLQIPRKSIIDKTVVKLPLEFIVGNTINKITSEGVVPTEVVVSYTNEDMAFLALDLININLDDVIASPITPGKTAILSNIENVKGVYVTNTGVVTFQKINMEDSISTKESAYIILSPTKNKRLQVHDRIVADVEKVSERQKIY